MLSTNEELLSLCRKIEMHGKPHPFISWFRQGLLEHECLAFIKWQIETNQGVRAILTNRERQQAIELFRRSSNQASEAIGAEAAPQPQR